MAGNLTIDQIQLGNNADPTRNFVLRTNADGTMTIARGNVGATTQDILKVETSGQLSCLTSLGYGVGAGGTVTQLTSKSTAVTLNKPTGKITLNNAALASNATIVFTLNNSFITANDTLVLSVDNTTTATDPSYLVQPYDVGNGTASIRVTNLTGGPLSEAVGINFSVIKGATT